MTVSRDPAYCRARLITLVHVAKQQLGLDVEQYRGILAAHGGGKTSSAELNNLELDRVMSYMRRLGFVVRAKGGKTATTKPSRRLALDEQSKKIRALWLLLRDLGALRNPSEAALAAYVRRMTGIDDLHWINQDQASAVIEALKKWAMRFLPRAIEQLLEIFRTIPLPDAHSRRINGALELAWSRRTFDAMCSAWGELKTVTTDHDSAIS